MIRKEPVAEDALPSFALAVPAGVTEIARKQADGCAYTDFLGRRRN